jgi:PIN domain nuclease of toxin-antitoxin system
LGCFEVIVLDTHIWIWWVHGDERLSPRQAEFIAAQERLSIGISAISCWEAAKLAERGRLVLPVAIEEWMGQALQYPGLSVLPLTPQIATTSTRLPGPFHQDPADQIIVATALVHRCPLVTSDKKLLAYRHIETIS